MRILGRSFTLVGAAIYLFALAALHWWSAETLWNSETVSPAIMSAIAALVLLFSLIGFFVDSVYLSALAVGLSFLLLGLSFYVVEHFDYSVLGPGYWVANGAAAAASLGGLFSFAGYAAPVRQESAGYAQAQAQTPPAGWYADPSGRASQRYWTGVAWSEQTR